MAPPLSDTQLNTLVEALLSSQNCVVITGAGCSTESSIPDYRGPNGAYTTGFTPMTHQQFMASPANRARYWARSFAGWFTFSAAQPNAAHEALARLQQRGWVSHIITQNVDRLHAKAGARHVLELHGTTHEVRCMSCGAVSSRHSMQQRLADLNPLAAQAAAHQAAGTSGSNTAAATFQAAAQSAGTAADASKRAQQAKSGTMQVMEVPVMRPDGDVELRDAGTSFVVPPCEACGGVLKPDVVFFGDGIPRPRAERALHLAQQCDLLLVVGSSLMVYSAYRLAEAAHKAGADLIALNVGPTRADKLLSHKVEVVAGEALMKLATHHQLLLPKV